MRRRTINSIYRINIINCCSSLILAKHQVLTVTTFSYHDYILYKRLRRQLANDQTSCILN
jgi:hypothetical protein